jgi:hypothetical protein
VGFKIYFLYVRKTHRLVLKNARIKGHKRSSNIMHNDDDDIYLINYNMAVGCKIYLHTNTDHPERHKYKIKSIRKIYS